MSAAQQPYEVGGDVSAPVPTARAEPQYSEAARAAELVGTVFLSMVVDASGMPTDIKVDRWRLRQKDTDSEATNPMGLDEEAAKALSKWRFRPAMKQGKPVAVRAKVEINFRL
ncbi:MAG: energy transducer TonB [Paludibaculum sp.]